MTDKEKLLTKIDNIIDRTVRPKLATHKGDVEIVDFDEDGVLWVNMLGECSGCPSSDDTAKELIQKELKMYIPQLKSVEVDDGLSDEEFESAMSLLSHRTGK